MDIRQLRYFVAIAQHRNYARAAEALSISQSALTQSIARLEQELQCRLLERGRFGAVLTPAGERLLVRGRVMIAESLLLQSEVRAAEGQARPAVRIGIGKSVAYHLLPRALERFLVERPDAAVTVLEGGSRDLFDRLGRGDLDFVVSAPMAQVDLTDDMKQERLLSQHDVVVVGSRHPVASLAKVGLADLTHHLWHAAPAGYGQVRFIQRVFRQAGVEPPTRFLRTDSIAVGNELVRTGVLISHGIREVVQSDLAGDEYRILSLPELTIDRPVMLTWRAHSAMHDDAAALMAQLRSTAAMSVAA